MMNKNTSLKAVVISAGLLVFVACKSGTNDKKSSGAMATMDASMAMSMDAAMPKPGPQHAMIQQNDGVWDAVIKMRPDPSAPEMVSKAMETRKTSAGGFWQVVEFSGDFMGTPFTGHGLNGYDPVKGKFVTYWVDSMNPIGAVYEGSYDAATNTMTTYASAPDPMRNNKVVYYKNVFQYHGNDAGTMTLSEIDLGVENKMLQIDYTRRK
ncbi:MAG: DUF1579 domain-containing protein [Planctomycetes bacterium]|nr:DUF1579 domain-containing protein [Planctomycetota bacterium]